MSDAFRRSGKHYVIRTEFGRTKTYLRPHERHFLRFQL